MGFLQNENRIMKVGINTSYFQDWGGGIDFIRLVLRGLVQISSTKNIEIVFVVEEQKKSHFVNRAIEGLKSNLKSLFFDNRENTNKFTYKTIYASLQNEGNFEWIFYNPNKKTIAKVVSENEIDFLIPCFSSMGKRFPIPWIGYIYDFQHKYMPELFSAKDIRIRNESFRTIISESKALIVNSIQVKNDIFKFNENVNSRIYSLPFCPLYDLNVYDKNILEKYKLLEQNYFLISNQFWKHKDHVTALRAFAKFIKEKHNSSIRMVCTGVLSDYRDYTFKQKIFDLIKELDIDSQLILTGFINKDVQKSLMQNAIALVQPTLFEGGPGGGAVFEALGLGIPVILSDIPVNLEIQAKNVLFFKSGDPKDLYEKMNEIRSFNRMKSEDLYLEKIEYEKLLGNLLWEAIDFLKSN